jgi:hypothetical protein
MAFTPLWKTHRRQTQTTAEEEGKEGQGALGLDLVHRRIVAQLVGAIATVALGVMVLHRYNARDSRPPAAPPPYEANGLPVALSEAAGQW